MELSYDSFHQECDIILRGSMSYRVALSTDARGNITRLDNALAGISVRLERAKEQLSDLFNQQEATKGELGKPFPQEEELAAKSRRLAELDAALNMEAGRETFEEKSNTEKLPTENVSKSFDELFADIEKERSSMPAAPATRTELQMEH